LDDHYKVLGMVPTSHTCDNVFELPNYWTSLVKTDQTGMSQEALRAKLRSLLAEKISVACDNSSGYGLDALDRQDSDSAASTPRIESAVSLKQDETKSEEAEEESVGESSGHISIPAMEEEEEEDDEVEAIDTPVKEVVVVERVDKSPEQVDDYAEDDYEDEFDFEDESVEL
jgi:hypothetical protein